MAMAQSIEKTQPTKSFDLASDVHIDSEMASSAKNTASLIPWNVYVLRFMTRGRNRMRQSRTYESVRGAASNRSPYRNHI